MFLFVFSMLFVLLFASDSKQEDMRTVADTRAVNHSLVARREIIEVYFCQCCGGRD